MEKTHIIKSFDGRSYDSKIPEDLVEVFGKLKNMLSELSNGEYECTPSIYDQNETIGVLCGILKRNENGSQTKLPYYLSIR